MVLFVLQGVNLVIELFGSLMLLLFGFSIFSLFSLLLRVLFLLIYFFILRLEREVHGIFGVSFDPPRPIMLIEPKKFTIYYNMR